MKAAHAPFRSSTGHRSLRLRSVLATLVAAGMALAGLVWAAPSAAEEIQISSLEIDVTACEGYGGQGNLHYVVRDPYPYYRDFVTVIDASDQIVHEATYLDEPELVQTEFEADVSLPPGTYTIIYTAERETGGANVDRQTFTIGACPDLDLSVTTSCSTGADGAATIRFTGLVSGEEYAYSVEGIDVSIFETFTASEPIEEAVAGDLPPGNYYAYVELRGDGPMYDWRAFAVEPCQPELVPAVAQCSALGGDASLSVTASRLVGGVAYTITGPDGTTRQVAADASGSASASFPKLEPGSTGSVAISGTWAVDEPYEEPPFIGGGDFIPLDTVTLADEVHVAFDACAAVLPRTGIDHIAPLSTGGLLLAAAGVLLLLIRRRTVTTD